MNEDLLGYLLGALEPHEMHRVEQWLSEDPAARDELRRLERQLRPLEGSRESIESPSPDLIDRTLAFLDEVPPVGSAATATARGDGATARGDSEGDATRRHERQRSQLPGMQAEVGLTRRGGLTWIDWSIVSAAAAVLLALALPAMLEGRFEARKTACQEQLRQLGIAVTSFVTRSPQNRLPAVAESGPEAFAGIYALRLADAGLLSTPDIRWCPASLRSDAAEPRLDQSYLVSTDRLASLPVDRLAEVQRFAGGDFAYTLGIIDGDRLAPPRFEGRTHFAVMSDAATSTSIGGQPDATTGHGGRGINVLFEDGRVEFVSLAELDRLPDHPWFNHRGRTEAGVHRDDASLGVSWRPPFVDAPQR